MYRITISPRAKKQLKQITLRYQKAIAQAIDELSEDPYIGKPLTRELIKRYSYRIGVYRIIYTINKKDRKLFIISAGHRANIYKLRKGK